VNSMNISDLDQDINILDSAAVREADTSRAGSDVITVAVPVRKTDHRESNPVFPATVVVSRKDTATTCQRNPIADVTFHDPSSLVNTIGITGNPGFPLTFIEKNKLRENQHAEALMKQLREGREIHSRMFENDWIIIVLLAMVTLYLILHKFSRNYFPVAAKFFFFRGIGDTGSRDTISLFHWQSTILNLVTFIILALFAYSSALFFGLVPPGMPGRRVWFFLFASIILVITLRHAVCFITGRLSDAKEVFDEYIVSIYQSYRLMAFFSILLIVLIYYTAFIPHGVLFITGFVTFAGIYITRVIHLVIIFIKRNISVLYLILYLCGLEFLPVLITLKCLTGLF
jgi:hypothetical protein